MSNPSGVKLIDLTTQLDGKHVNELQQDLVYLLDPNRVDDSNEGRIVNRFLELQRLEYDQLLDRLCEDAEIAKDIDNKDEYKMLLLEIVGYEQYLQEYEPEAYGQFVSDSKYKGLFINARKELSKLEEDTNQDIVLKQ